MNRGKIPPDFDALESALSADRFRPYVLSCGGDKAEALRLYELNTRVSAALYEPLQTLEVTLRNCFHARLSQAYGDWWFDRGDVIWELFQRRRITDAQVDLAAAQKPLTPGRVVASLMFGFWTACLTAPYDQVLWRAGGLSKAFMEGGEKPKRGRVNAMLNPIRKLRNRVAHHEPILYFNLPKHYANMVTLTGWLSPATAEWAAQHAIFPNVYDEDMARKLLAPGDR